MRTDRTVRTDGTGTLGMASGAAAQWVGRTLRTVMMATVAATALSGASTAQEAAPASTTSGEVRMAFSIPAQSLNGALLALAKTAGIEILFDADQVAGQNAAAVNGRYTVREALDILLRNTGLSATVNSTGTVFLSDTTESSGIVLSPILVESGQLRRGGYAESYVATGSGAGTKTDTPIIETPQSVSVVTREEIEATNADTITQALSYTPGINAQSPAFSRSVDDLMLRGFNVASGGSGMMRDGMKLQSNVYDGGQEPYGLERIEVVRGPASILYGQLSPGGAVNAITKKPTATPFGEIGIEGGSYEHKQVEADVGTPIGDSDISVRLTGMTRDAELWIDHVPNDRTYIAPSLTWAPGEDTALTLMGSYQTTETRFVAPMPHAALSSGAIRDDLFIGEPDFDKYDTDVYTVGYSLSARATDWLKLRSSLRYYRSEVDWDYLTFGALTGTTLYRGVSQRDETSTGLTADNSVEISATTGAIGHTLIAGLDYYKSTYDRHRFRGGVTTLDVANPQYGTPIVPSGSDFGDDTESTQVGLYAQDQMKVFDKLVVLLGGRHDWSDTSVTSYATNTTTDQDEQAFTGRAGLVYLFDNGLAPYASVSESFQPQSGTDRQGNTFDPTRGTQYEAGLRYQPPGSDLLVSAAYYQLTQTNVLTTDPVDTTFSVQTGEVESQGIELEAKAGLGDLNLIAAYTYTDARVTESNDLSELGEQTALVPMHAISGWADYGLGSLGLPGLRIGGGVKYVGETNIPGYASNVSGYALVDTMARFDMGSIAPDLDGVILKLNVSNLTDTDYMTCVNEFACRYGEPRTVTAGLTYRW